MNKDKTLIKRLHCEETKTSSETILVELKNVKSAISMTRGIIMASRGIGKKMKTDD